MVNIASRYCVHSISDGMDAQKASVNWFMQIEVVPHMVVKYTWILLAGIISVKIIPKPHPGARMSTGVPKLMNISISCPK